MSGYPGAAPNMAVVKAFMAVTHTEFTEGNEVAFRMPPGNEPMRYAHCALGATVALAPTATARTKTYTTLRPLRFIMMCLAAWMRKQIHIN